MQGDSKNYVSVQDDEIWSLTDCRPGDGLK